MRSETAVSVQPSDSRSVIRDDQLVSMGRRLWHPIGACQRHPITLKRHDSVMSVGKRIKEAREAKGLSRPQLADLTGIKYPTLAGIENGDQGSSTQIPVIADVLGVNPLWLSTGRGPKNLSALPESPRQSSHLLRPDPNILHEALTLLVHDEGKAGPYPMRAMTERLLELYDWCAREGGRLSRASNDLFEAQCEERAKGKVSRGESSESVRRRRARRR